MDREDKQLEAALDTLISKLNDVKQSLGSFIVKLETEGHAVGEPINWPSVLESFALLSSQFNVVMRFLKSDHLPNFRNRILLPLHLNPDKDDELTKLTEGRVQAFNHEMVPSYLRTKWEPEIERNEQTIQTKASLGNADQAQKSVAGSNKIVTSLTENIKAWREKYETSDPTLRERQLMTSSNEDTRQIIAAVALGKGLKEEIKPQVMNQPPPTGPPSQPPQQGRGGGKAPPAIKTNIRTNPYGRN